MQKNVFKRCMLKILKGIVHGDCNFQVVQKKHLSMYQHIYRQSKYGNLLTI